MKYKRYGDFNMGDYMASWLGIAVLVCFSIGCVACKLNLLLCVFPILYSIIWLGTIILPNCERFTLTDNLITAFIIKNSRMISLPPKVVLIISRVDIAPPFAHRTPTGNETHILKGKYAVSIIKMMPLENVLDILHRNYTCEYTSSIIRTVFNDSYYVYSFVFDQRLLQNLITNREYRIIIPESVLEDGLQSISGLNVFVDIGY